MAGWSWRAWPDPFIDFGREAYVAWRLAEGAVLHRDVVYVSGPLSPYWNALLFRGFGVGLDTLFVANAVVLVALVGSWYVLLRSVADRAAAWAGGLVFVTLFAFAQYVGIGNYNYIAPYSHELTHGLLLASLGLLCWHRILRTGNAFGWLGAGFSLGLVALTKMEVLAAAAAANGLGIVAVLHARSELPGRLGPGLAIFAAGAVAPIVFATLWLAAALGAGPAVEAVGIGWVHLFAEDLASLPFYQRGMGTDDPAGNFAIALLWAARMGGVLAPAAVAALALRSERFGRPWIPALAFVVMAGALAPFVGDLRWLQAARPLPLFGLFALVYCAVRLARPEAAARRARWILQAMLVTFATALLAKIFLLARIYQYGFVLALPASLLFVAALVAWIPGEIRRRGGSGQIFRAAALGLLAVAVIGHLQTMAPHVDARTERLGGVHDAIRVTPVVARVVGRALAAVHATTQPNDTLAVLPEGVMLNFLTRRPTPTPHFSFNPFELRVHGEDEILRAFANAPPAAIVIVHHDTSEHGARFLGRDYGVGLMDWVQRTYTPVLQMGDPPLQPGTRFGVTVLERARSRP